jgi:hypothetical protein
MPQIQCAKCLHVATGLFCQRCGNRVAPEVSVAPEAKPEPSASTMADLGKVLETKNGLIDTLFEECQKYKQAHKQLDESLGSLRDRYDALNADYKNLQAEHDVAKQEIEHLKSIQPVVDPDPDPDLPSA